jgi:hypothetical protein
VTFSHIHILYPGFVHSVGKISGLMDKTQKSARQTVLLLQKGVSLIEFW